MGRRRRRGSVDTVRLLIVGGDDRSINNAPILVGSDVLTAVVMKSYIFCDVISCSPLKANRRFVVTCSLHLQDLRLSQARNKCGSKWQTKVLKMEVTCSFEKSNNCNRTLHIT
jgi:hypothetical protein